MSGFRALNIEYDDESDVEVDDTKELQIEEALKLYQRALKLHADGPALFEEAAQAYCELFQSEIFKYPESQTELDRIGLYGPAIDVDDLWDETAPSAGPAEVANLESGPSTLPQILHLAHKNFAHFKLEHLELRLGQLGVALLETLQSTTDALEHFMAALDKDDTDLDLWRRTASVGGLLNAKRIARFCLESVLDNDDENLESVLSLPGLEDGLVAEQLRELVAQLKDHLSLAQLPLLTIQPNSVSKIPRERLENYRDMAHFMGTLRMQQAHQQPLSTQPMHLNQPRTWAELGDALLRRTAEQEQMRSRALPSAVRFDLKPVADSPKMDLTTSGPTLSGQSHLPLSIDEQFPGLDRGRPTMQPQLAPAHADMLGIVCPPEAMDLDSPEALATSLSTRKRSGDVAGLADGGQDGRAKSKRTRTRESTAAEETKQAIMDANRQWEFDQQINEFQAADDWMFETIGNLFERIGIVGLQAARHVRQEIQSPRPDDCNLTGGDDADRSGLELAKVDLQAFLVGFSEPLADNMILSGDEPSLSTIGVPAASSLSSDGFASSAMQHKAATMIDAGLMDFLQHVNHNWYLPEEVVWMWIARALNPATSSGISSYREHLWPSDFKKYLVQCLVNFDESLYARARAVLQPGDIVEGWSMSSSMLHNFAEVIEAIFELHLDVYCLIKSPGSGVDSVAVDAQQHRLCRWSSLAHEAIYSRSMAVPNSSSPLEDDLNLRFLWATTFQIGASSEAPQDYTIQCLHELRAILVATGRPAVHLQNNAIMPVLSASALDREIARLRTRELFLKVTSQDLCDPVNIIETLEPLLVALAHATYNPNQQVQEPPNSSDVSPELVEVLQKSDFSVRLMLWHRLRDAYTAIDYNPMVLWCYLNMIQDVVHHFKTTLSTTMPPSDRQTLELKTLRTVFSMTRKALTLMDTSEDSLDCLDDQTLKSTVGAYADVLQLIQVFNTFEDGVKVGKRPPPASGNSLPSEKWKALMDVVHEMQIHIWLVIYKLFKEAIAQFPEAFPSPDEDKFDFLRVIHRNFGLRAFCGVSDRAFVSLLKVEFFQMTHVEGYDAEQAQVLYDLYGLNCFLNPEYEIMEHGCIPDDLLSRDDAMQAVDLLMQQASKLPIRDLAKHSLKDAIEKVHGAATRKRPTEVILRNREIYRAFFKSPINPLDLFQCLRGEGNELDVSPVPKCDAPLASKGWYFLMGHMALAKFKSQKRISATPTEDVEIAIAFFNQDLEYSPGNWETWFRLAQAYDTKIEENVVWTAEKLNHNMTELVQHQRAAIHSYAMATALAYRGADFGVETSEKMTEMFADFAMRIYASSREPFAMKPFAFGEAEKWFSLQDGMTKGQPFTALKVYTAWKLASALFRRALSGRPQSWHLHFMLGKCLWKMHTAEDVLQERHPPPSAQQVLRCFIKAIELLPEKKDSRDKREPSLEPHYKLVSVIHKLICRNTIALNEAVDALKNTPYARSVAAPPDLEKWVPYVLSILKNLRTADKSNWHHRIIMRAAHIVYNDGLHQTDNAKDPNLGALGAKHELTQQLFTKTMVLQAWRPECERAGRHFVYTSRYTRFFVHILEQLKDRSNLDQLARRVRRRLHDLFEHGQVWQDICVAYLRLLRRSASLVEGQETSTFSNIPHEDFIIRKELLEKWMRAQETGSSPALDVLREVQEFKKTNSSLMKPGLIDDLIGDAYGYLFANVGVQLLGDARRVEEEEEARRSAVSPSASSPSRNYPMSVTNLVNPDAQNAQNAPTMSLSISSRALFVPPEAPSGRKKPGIGRREIRAAAESCCQKPVASVKNSSTHQTTLATRPDSLPCVRVMTKNSKPAGAQATANSTDDESELSDLCIEGENDDDTGGNDTRDEDDETAASAKMVSTPRPMFPGLAVQQVAGADSRQTSRGPEETGEVHPGGNRIQDGEDVVMTDADERPSTPHHDDLVVEG